MAAVEPLAAFAVGVARRFVCRRELDSRSEAWRPILTAARRGPVTLVYSSHETEHNNAVALQECLQAKLRRPVRAVAAEPARHGR